MKLKEYLDSNGLSTYAFAKVMADTGRDVNQSVVWRWCAEQQRPDWTTVPYITKATKGKVTAMDFVPEID
jgi:DNA-binding transcriptional regulator YdaS (Cro superfamily)